MPKLKDAAMLVAGQVIDVETLTNRDTNVPEGARVTLLTGDGFALIKVRQADYRPDLFHVTGSYALMVRPLGWGDNNNGGGMSVSFIRYAEPGDLDLVHSVASNMPTAKAAKAA